MTSNKVCDDSQRRRGDAEIQNDQQKSGKLLSRVQTAIRANSDFISWVSLWKWYATLNVRAVSMKDSNVFFRWTYPSSDARLGTPKVITYFSSGLIPLYKSFSLWKQRKAIFGIEIILLLLGDKWGNSEQHGCFSLVLFTPPHSTLPIQSSNKRTTVQQGRRLVKDSTHFSSSLISFIYKKESDTSSRRIRHIHYP